MKVAIIDLTTQAPEIADMATAGQTIRAWLAPAMPADRLEIVAVADGVPLPAVEAHDAYVISGSEKGVYDETPWMVPMRSFLQQARLARKPMFGICFGHQLMADTFGGKAELSTAGERVGAERYAFDGLQFEAHVWHRDQVTAVPADARVLGGADYCPHGVLEYAFGAASVQFHPELDRRFMREVLQRFAGVHYEPDEVARFIRSIEAGKVAPDLFAARAARVLRGGGLRD